MLDNKSDVPAARIEGGWSIRPEYVGTDEMTNLIEFTPLPVPVVIHHFGFMPGECFQNEDAMKIDEVDHIEACLIMRQDVSDMDEARFMRDFYPIVDEVVVRQFMMKNQYDENGSPINVGKLMMSKEARWKVAYRGAPSDYPHGMSWQHRTNQLLKQARKIISIQVQDLLDYRSGKSL